MTTTRKRQKLTHVSVLLMQGSLNIFMEKESYSWADPAQYKLKTTKTKAASEHRF